MTYIELCRAVRARLGLQGSGPDSVTTGTDAEMDIVHAVTDAYTDIQNMREEWRWLRDTANFTTSIGTTTYTRATIFSGTARFRKWKKDHCYITINSQKTKLTHIPYDEFYERHANNTINGTVSEFTYNKDNSILITPPDDLYAIEIDYWKSPQTLASASDTPEMPSHWHNLIVYAALEKLGTTFVSPEKYQHFSQQYAEGMGQLMREHLGKKRIYVRSIA